MTDALLATDTEQSKDATTTPGDAANVDTQVAPEQQTQVEPETTSKPTEDKPAESQTEPEKKGEEKTEDKPEGAPERYAFAVPEGMPEGFEKDPQVFDALADASRELDLTQDKAQKLVNHVLPVLHRRAEEQQAETHDKWIAEVKADPEIGGQRLDENLGIAKRAVVAFASDGMQELLNGPLGSHPEVVRFLVKVGQTVSEDQFVSGGQAGESVDLNDSAAVAKKLYPKSL